MAPFVDGRGRRYPATLPEKMKHWFHSEFCLSERQASEVSSILEKLKQDLAGYDTSIATLEAKQQRKAKVARSALRSYTRQCECLLSPVRKLPTEIFLHIFESCATDPDTCNRLVFNAYWLESKRPEEQLALSLSTVCVRWRKIALSCGTLWSHIHTNLPTQRQALRTMSLYTQRTAQLFLTIVDDSKSKLRNDPLLDHLVAQAHHWRSLSVRTVAFTAGHIENNHLFPARGSLHCPILKYLTIIHRWSESSPQLDTFSNASQLTHLELHYCVFAKGLVPLSFPYPQLSEMVLRDCSGQIFEILEKCTNLQDLHLKDTRIEDTLNNQLVLSKLTRLRIEISGSSDEPGSIHYLECFGLPHLRSLELVSKGWGSFIRPGAMINALILRSPCSLTNLALTRIPLSDLDVLSLLTALPSLCQIALEEPPEARTFYGNGQGFGPLNSFVTPTFLARLVVRPEASGKPLLPALQTLSLTIAATESFDDARLVEAITSRWILATQARQLGIECLRSVHVRFTRRPLDALVYAPVKELEEVGMCVNLRGSGKPLTEISRMH